MGAAVMPVNENLSAILPVHGEFKRMQLTYKFRLRDTADSELQRQARAVNYVFNFCNETQKTALKWGKKWPSGYDLQKLTAGSSVELDLHAHTIQQVCQQYERNRRQHRKASLRWRGRKSLGWVPFNKGHVTYRNGVLWFRGRAYRAWVSRELQEGQKFGAGSFNQDSLGHWYINLPVEIDTDTQCGTSAVGVDLGIKDIATLSTGRKIEHPRWYLRMQARIGMAQRANKTRQTKKLARKASNQRADFLHKASSRIVHEHGAIFVGNVNPSGIAKTRMSKSSLDAGWAMFKQQLAYKAIRHGALFKEVDEAFSTQTCSQCGSIEGPKGLKGLGIREWTCTCGAGHNRDTNAAHNILAGGLASLAEGASA